MVVIVCNTGFGPTAAGMNALSLKMLWCGRRNTGT